MFKIYALTYNNVIIYIGQTTLSLSRRLSGEHYNIPYDKKDLSIELLEETDDVSRERHWIDFCRNKGVELLNRRSGNTGITDPVVRKEYNRIRKNKHYNELKQDNRKV